MANQNGDALPDLQFKLLLLPAREKMETRRRYVARVFWRSLLVAALVGLFVIPEHYAHMVCLGVCGAEILRLGWNFV